MFCLAVLINQGTFAPTKLTYNKMKKILFAISTMALLLCACSKDEKDLAPVDMVTDGELSEEQIYNHTGCRPTNVEDIKTYKLYKDTDNTKYLYGSKYKDGEESFWFAQYNSSGEQQWEIVHKDNQFASHAYGPVQIKNGNIVVNNVVKEGFVVYRASPVIIDKKGKAKYIKVFDDKYIYTDISIYDNFFFTTISLEEINKTPNAINRAAQISNSGDILRLFPKGTEQMVLPKKDEKFIWASDSTYTTISVNNVQQYYIVGSQNSPVWTFLVNLPKYKSCDMGLAVKDTAFIASYYLEYTNGEKDTICYNISSNTGEEIVEAVKLQGLSFTETKTTIKQGNTFVIKPVFTPENATNKKIRWTSSDESIATVDQNGKVLANLKGECFITAVSEDGGYEAQCKIIVTEPTIEELIITNVYGSVVSINDKVISADVIAAFYNNSDKTVEVTELTMYDTKTNKVVYQQKDCGFVEYKKPLQYELKFSMVYKPLFIWKYTCDGKSYEVSYQM